MRSHFRQKISEFNKLVLDRITAAVVSGSQLRSVYPRITAIMIVAVLIIGSILITLPIRQASATPTPGLVDVGGTFGIVFAGEVSLTGYFSGHGGWQGSLNGLTFQGRIPIDSSSGVWTVGGELCASSCKGFMDITGGAHGDGSVDGKFTVTVTFSDGGKLHGQGTFSGTASESGANGTYSGKVQVEAPPFDFKVDVISPISRIVHAGGEASYILTVTPISGTPQPVTLHVSTTVPRFFKIAFKEGGAGKLAAFPLFQQR